MKELGAVPFEEFNSVRIVEQDGRLMFVAADACAAVGITNYRRLVARLPADDRSRVSFDTGAGPRELVVISEAGLWTIVLRSQEALTPGTLPFRFREWVVKKLIPEARERQGYQLVPPGYQLAPPGHRVLGPYVRKSDPGTPLENPEHDELARFFAEYHGWPLKQTRHAIFWNLKRCPSDLARMRAQRAKLQVKN